MNREQRIYSLLDQSLSDEDQRLFEVILEDGNFTEIERLLFNEGLRAYICLSPSLIQTSLSEVMALVSKLEAIDKSVALVVATGLSVSRILDYEYQLGRDILKRAKVRDVQGYLGALRTIVLCLEDFLDLKLAWDLPNHKVIKSLERFEIASNELREKGQVRASVYIGLVGLRMSQRILPSLKLDWMLGQLKSECNYYGWTDLLAFFEEKEGKDSAYVNLETLRRQGALEEWLYFVESTGREALDSGDMPQAAACYKTVADYLLHGL